ncbi:MAG: peptidase domain-containing ABC transporter [Lactobacillales bacterium]|jgi:ATP-binding cassette subfamily B protein|nr:peptidase domain-containing ABC transporter [Lactobacillales bacterium]
MIRRVRQNEQRDCGAAAFATLANLHGKSLTLAAARDLTRSNTTGTTLQGLVEAGNQIGLEAKALEGTFEELIDGIENNEITLPFISLVVFDTGLAHFLVIEKCTNSAMKVFDPAKGMKKYTYDEFKKIWENYIVVFDRTDNFVKDNRNFSSQYVSILIKEKLILTIVILFSIFMAVFSFLGSFSYQRIIDAFILNDGKFVQENHDHTFLEGVTHGILYNFHYLIWAIVLLYVFQMILSIFRSFFIAKVSKRMNDDLFNSFFKKILFMKAVSLKGRDSGELITRYNITTQVQQVVTRLVLSIFLEIFVAIAGGVILFMISKTLFLTTTIILIGYMIISLIFIKPLNKLNSELIEKNARSLNVLNEVLTGFETIKLLQSEELFLNKFMKRAKSFTNTGKYSVILQNTQASLITWLESVGVIFVLWQGSSLVVDEKLSLGSLITFITLITFYTSPVRNIIDFQREIQNVVVMVRKLSDVMDSISETQEFFSQDREYLESIEFQNIYFSYAADESIISDFSMKFNMGTSYAIIGKSGSGKTTLLNIISSLYRPDKGIILLNDKDIRKESYRQHVSHVSSNPFLMSGTIRDNLLLGIEDFDEQYFNKLLRVIGINEMTDTFSNGIDSLVLENGENLSSGQKQRIGIVRALLRKPAILLLDEALSNLDTDSKMRIMHFIENDLKSCLRIYVSHDDTISSNVDCVINFS